MTTHREDLISFVVPFFDEGVNVELFHAAVTEATAGLTYGLEFVYVNDGSRDDTLDRLQALAAMDPRVTVLDLAHNRGHQIAVTAGLDHAPGDAVIVMDADLQDPPAVALELIRAWEDGADVAFAQRRTRRDTMFKKATAAAYYRGLAAISEVDIPRDTGDFRLLDRRVVEELKKYREPDRYLRGIVASLGFRQVAVPFDRDERRHGESHYPLKKMVKLAVDGVLGFSTAPLAAITRTGAAVTAAGLAGGLALAVARASGTTRSDSSATVLAGTAMLGGLQLMALGVVGAYVGRIHHQTQDRPLYAVASLLPARARLTRRPGEVTRGQSGGDQSPTVVPDLTLTPSAA